MIKKIVFLKNDKTILYCDGKKFEVIGDSPLANSIRGISKNPTSLFMKITKEDGDKFDPVEYWYGSSQNFADEGPPTDFSEEKLKEFISMLEG